MTRKKLVQDQFFLCSSLLTNSAINIIETSIQPSLNCNPKTLCKVGRWKAPTNSNSKWKPTQILWDILRAISWRRSPTISHPHRKRRTKMQYLWFELWSGFGLYNNSKQNWWANLITQKPWKKLSQKFKIILLFC